MELALDLVARQLVMLGVLAAVGSGPASLLPASVAPIARIALVPVLGLALGAAILLDAGLFVSMSVAAWLVLVPLAIASVVFAVVRTRRGRGFARPQGKGVIALIVLVFAAGAAVDAPLVSQDTLGPMAYQIPDAGYLVSQHNALEDSPLRGMGSPITQQALRQIPHNNAYYSSFSPARRHDFVNLMEDTYRVIPAGYASQAAAVDSLLGWHAVDTQTAFLGVLMLLGALGVFALTLFLTGSVLAALFAGLLLVGPLDYQLYVESGEGNLSGTSMIAPIALFGILMLRDPTPAVVGLFGLAFAGLGAVYGLWVPGVVGMVGLAVVCVAINAWRNGILSRVVVKRGALALGAAALIAILLSPFAFVRNVGYWHVIGQTKVLEDLVALGIPRYHLPLDVLPGWLMQTREFYSLPPIHLDEIKGLSRGLLLPLLLMALALFGAWRWRERGSLLLLVAIPVAAAFAYRAFSGYDCTYCVQRQLVILAPVIAVLLGAGLAALPLAAGWRALAGISWARPALAAAAVVVGVAVLALAGQKSTALARRAVNGGYLFDPDARTIASKLANGGAPVLVEAGGASNAVALELPATYYSVREATGTRPSLATGTNDFAAITPFTRDQSVNLGFRPGYRLVVTRIGSVKTPRRTIARDGPYALQLRAEPLDVSLVDGVTPDLVRRDPLGLAWVSGPLSFAVDGEPGPAYVRLRFTGPSAGSTVLGAGAPRGTTLHKSGRSVAVCLPVRGPGEVRYAPLRLRFHELADQPPPEQYATAYIPGKGLRLAAMSASRAPC